MRWFEVDKGDPRCRELADRHYSRQTIGHPMWTRPGWNFVLYAEQRNGRSAVFCWWRPKWEAGVLRKDGLRAIECTIFRNETRFWSSDLIRDAVAAVQTWEHAVDVEWPDGLITGVNAAATAQGRSDASRAGHCFREAGWRDFDHKATKSRADVWLRFDGELPSPERPRVLMRGRPHDPNILKLMGVPPW